MRSIIWFRRDLRTNDNPALYHACHDSEQVIAIFFIAREQWQQHNEADCKINFWLKNLQSLKIKLSRLNIPLLVYSTHNYSQIPEELSKAAKKYNCDRLYYNLEYEPNEKIRDEQTEKRLKRQGIKTYCFHDRLVIEPGTVLTGKNKPYVVFTPYKNKWAETLKAKHLKTLQEPKPTGLTNKIQSDEIPDFGENIDKNIDKLWPAGENHAASLLNDFLKSRINHYNNQRDLPAVNGTSKLSPYLAAGVISPRQCLAPLVQIEKDKVRLPAFSTSTGTWINELVWREFYNNILIEFPRVGKNLPFKLNTEKISWNYHQQHLEAWQKGLTGYPIVDAAMRQLKKTGWMHNRLRMICAMFLSKHLLLDWRLGEAWFMKNLIDGDLASNNGGWQWSASTGTDAVPYFRVFNPFSQSARFDKNGDFIKKYCPELENLPAKTLHDPLLLAKASKQKKIDYPEPLVEHANARKKAIAVFKNLHQ
jgi:deoxyribodipyrimidine photo-lyase